VDRLWPSGSRSSIFGAEVCSCCMCTCVVYASAAAQGASKYTSLEYVRLPSLAVAWQSVEPGHYSTQNDVISILSLRQIPLK
jgi:hypothetical protein